MVIASSTVTADTLNAAAAAKEDTGWILHHVMDSREIELPFLGYVQLPEFHLFGYDLSITKHVLIMWVVCLLLIIVFRYAANSYKKSLVPSGLANFLEVFIVFVRDEIAKPTIGKGYEWFLPYLLTAFFFILTCNFIGLIPYSATATGNISVTAVLATLSFIVIQLGGIKKNGLFGYFKGLMPHGLPFWLVPLMFVVEILGLFTKPFALAIRLFANMSAGHIVILSLLGLIFITKSYMATPLSVSFALFINMLEILVALIQAYIFTMLTSLFIGFAVHQEH